MKKKNKKTLKSLFKEDIQGMIAAYGPQPETDETDISLDKKVDHFLIQYEREALPNAALYQTESKEDSFSLKDLVKLLEAPDEPEDPNEDPNAPPEEENADGGGDPAAGGGLDLGGGGGGSMPSLGGGGESGADLGAAGGGDQNAGSLPQKPAVTPPKINMQNFASSLARLVNDYQNLIDPKRIILNRAKAYIEKNYNPAMAKKLMDILDSEYDLSPESPSDKSLNVPTDYAIGSLEPIGTE